MSQSRNVDVKEAAGKNVLLKHDHPRLVLEAELEDEDLRKLMYLMERFGISDVDKALRLLVEYRFLFL